MLKKVTSYDSPRQRPDGRNCIRGLHLLPRGTSDNAVITIAARGLGVLWLCWSMWDNGHDDVIKWKHFPRYWPFVRGIHRSPVNSPPKGQWRGALMFSLICVWINGWVNNREAGDLRGYHAHYDVTGMAIISYIYVLLGYGCDLGTAFTVQFEIHFRNKYRKPLVLWYTKEAVTEKESKWPSMLLSYFWYLFSCCVTKYITFTVLQCDTGNGLFVWHNSEDRM